MGDTGTHLTGTDYPDFLDFHDRTISRNFRLRSISADPEKKKAGAVRHPAFFELSLERLKRFFEFRKGVEKIGDEAVIGDLENRRFFILVDGDDNLRVFHAG